MSYVVKEVFLTLQGEGAHKGRVAVFCRFAGCNLWSGLERDRASAVCRFCDTNFVGTDGPGGGSFATADELAAAIARAWPGGPVARPERPFVVFTGGEPLLQLDEPLLDEMPGLGFETAVETNGTRRVPRGTTGCASARRPVPTSCSPLTDTNAVGQSQRFYRLEAAR